MIFPMKNGLPAFEGEVEGTPEQITITSRGTEKRAEQNGKGKDGQNLLVSWQTLKSLEKLGMNNSNQRLWYETVKS
jgi:hypothetical protein